MRHPTKIVFLVKPLQFGKGRYVVHILINKLYVSSFIYDYSKEGTEQFISAEAAPFSVMRKLTMDNGGFVYTKILHLLHNWDIEYLSLAAFSVAHEAFNTHLWLDGTTYQEFLLKEHRLKHEAEINLVRKKWPDASWFRLSS